MGDPTPSSHDADANALEVSRVQGLGFRIPTGSVLGDQANP